MKRAPREWQRALDIGLKTMFGQAGVEWKRHGICFCFAPMRQVLASLATENFVVAPLLETKEVYFSMRKIILAIALVAATTASVVVAPQAQAQQYPSVTGLTPFSAQCNYMSKAGYLRYRYFVSSGRWISYEEANRVATEQG